MVRSISQRTLLNGQMLRVEWKVEDILCSGSLDSGIFDFHGFQGKLCLEKRDIYYCETKHRICITLSEINSTGGKRVGIQSYIEDRARKARYYRENSFVTACESSKVVWNMDFSTDMLQMKGELMTDGLTFVVTLMANYEDRKITKVNKALQAFVDTGAQASLKRLAVDFSCLLDDGTHSDVTLKCGDRTVPAHRNVLSVRSKVLAAMLSTDMVESRTGVIEMSDMAPSIFDQLVQFVYSARVSDLTLDTAQQLYTAGDKYAIDTLKRQCSAFMKKNLTDANVCSVVALADAHSDADLKEWAVLYIMQTELMRKDDIWLKFCDDHPRLANEILNRVYKEGMCFKPPQ